MNNVDPDRKLLELADGRATPTWARSLILDCLRRDPVDVSNVLDVLSDLFTERTRRILWPSP